MSEALKRVGNWFDMALGVFVVFGAVAYFFTSNISNALSVTIIFMFAVATIAIIFAIFTWSDIRLTAANAFGSTAFAIGSVIRIFAVVWSNEAVMTLSLPPLLINAVFAVGIAMYAAASAKEDGAEENFVIRFFALLPIVGMVFRRAIMPFLPAKEQSA